MDYHLKQILYEDMSSLQGFVYQIAIQCNVAFEKKFQFLVCNQTDCKLICYYLTVRQC